MHLIFLGTASCCPTEHRAVSCTAVKFSDGDVWLFDCGEGSQVQIQKSNIHCGKVKKIFITHLHGDHLFGLPGLMCSVGTMERKEEFVLDLYGPLGLRRYIRESLNLSRSPLNIKFIVHELVPLDFQYPNELKNWKVLEEAENPLHPQEILGRQISSSENIWTLFQDSHATVKAGVLVHRIPSFGFSIHQNSSPGTLNTALLMQSGIQPGPLYGKLKQGKPITLKNGTIINPQDVVGPPIPGLKITILGDTCDSSGMSEIAKESDVLVHEATLEDGLQQKAIDNGHSTPSMAAAFAKQIRAKHLILFHFSQRYKIDDEEPSLKILYNETKEAFNKLDYNCDVTIAQDLLSMDFSRHRSTKD